MAAGEVSGDRQAGDLARAILVLRPDAVLFGTGGEQMRQAGVNLLIQSSQYGSAGIQESFRYIRPLWHVMSELRDVVRATKPDLAVLVDSEGFNTLFAGHLYSRGMPFIFYFPPQVWVWGEWRARTIARRARVIIPAFKMEAEIYRREGGNVAWFGHPLLDIVQKEPDADRVLASYGLDPEAPTMGIMPGSRFHEIEQLLPILLAATRIVQRKVPSVQVILPLAAPHLRDSVMKGLAAHGMMRDVTVVSDRIYACLSKCRVVMLSSGTATVELSLLGIPMVVGYKVSRMTHALARPLIKARYLAMPNVLLDREAVPEFLQYEATPDAFAREALRLLLDRDSSARTLQDLAQVRALLGEPGATTRTANLVLAEAERCIPVNKSVAVPV